MLQSLLYFWNSKTQAVFFISYERLLYSKGKNKVVGNTKKKKINIVLQKYAKFWSVSVGLFIEHKCLIIEECWISLLSSI